MEPHIRLYQPQDKDQLLTILSSNIPQYFHPSELEDFSHYLDDEVEDYFVVETAQGLIAAGGINYELSQNTAKLSWDFVASNLQQQGWGARLLIHRLSYIRSNPAIERITVRTSQLADQFYAKHGFKELNRIKDYWAEGFDLVHMEYHQEFTNT